MLQSCTPGYTYTTGKPFLVNHYDVMKEVPTPSVAASQTHDGLFIISVKRLCDYRTYDVVSVATVKTPKRPNVAITIASSIVGTSLIATGLYLGAVSERRSESSYLGTTMLTTGLISEAMIISSVLGYEYANESTTMVTTDTPRDVIERRDCGPLVDAQVRLVIGDTTVIDQKTDDVGMIITRPSLAILSTYDSSVTLYVDGVEWTGSDLTVSPFDKRSGSSKQKIRVPDGPTCVKGKRCGNACISMSKRCHH